MNISHQKIWRLQSGCRKKAKSKIKIHLRKGNDMADFWTTVQDAADNAPEAGFSSISFGRLHITPMVVTWETTGETNEAGKPIRKPNKEEMKPNQQLKE